MSNKNKASQPAPTVSDGPVASDNVTKLSASSARRVDALDAFNARIGEAISGKVQFLQETETAIAEVVALSGDLTETAERDSKIAEASAKAAFLLFRGVADTVITREEASELLGRSFGWKTKQNGEQSKTPHGQGEAIRKRVVRAVDARTYATGGEAKAFFQPLERDAVADMIAAVETGQRSVFTLYDDLADMKADATGQRPKPAFDPKRIMALAASLGENVEASVSLWHETPGLFEAYAGLSRIMRNVSAEYAIAHPETIAA